jgi:hypothetical protein
MHLRNGPFFISSGEPDKKKTQQQLLCVNQNGPSLSRFSFCSKLFQPCLMNKSPASDKVLKVWHGKLKHAPEEVKMASVTTIFLWKTKSNFQKMIQITR